MEKNEKNNVNIALNVVCAKKGKTYSSYISKHNSNHEKLVIILMISNGEKLWHYLAFKNLSALLYSDDDFYFYNRKDWWK